RVFATIASQVLNLKVYDTQCGAKLFRVGEALRVAMEQDFVSSWAFDVELIGRLRQQLPESAFLEVPLNRWIDVEGSKIGLMDMLQATLSLISIRRALNANR
ncbi:MAG: dolichyl-phosphate beta-glucosyltransferase, partial [Dinoroseobacter sp.]